ncbi:MAG TPA: glucose 1-dehydrogenase [Thermoleophilaceae bacterium]|jgi:NAD(P)-dependent dehydrogenase (short-subunit alcohol dehydrogenase family)|nr:glucose 1-dehydrogenase [Thermoleophilaceae bacterium]
MTKGAAQARLAGARIAVTGGGSGIGRASCERLAAEGARVLVLDLDAQAAEAAAAEIRAEGGDAVAAELDVSAAEAEERLTELVERQLGELDGLVNNAGVGAAGSILETGDEDWRRLFAVNVDGVFRCSRAVLPAMLARGAGSIVNMASVAGIVGLTNRFAYCATKGAVVAMTKAMALDFAGTGVRVNCICPGTIHTPWVESFAAAAPDPDVFRAQMAARQPVGRMGTADEIAAAVAYLCSEDSSFMTGSELVVDGGLTAGVPKPRV